MADTPTDGYANDLSRQIANIRASLPRVEGAGFAIEPTVADLVASVRAKRLALAGQATALEMARARWSFAAVVG